MKSIQLLCATLVLLFAFTSCSDSNDDPIVIDDNPLAEYTLLAQMTSNNHTIEVYSEDDQFTIGYNELFLRIKDEASESYFSNAEVSWKPMMHMTEMMHSCPYSNIEKTDNASVYKGFTVFQMPGNADEYWELEMEYTVDGQTYNATQRIEVKAPADDKKRVSVFMGTDDMRYVLTMMPLEPEVAVNDFSAMLFKMENMMSFPIVEDYKVKIDPRMPGMGNHSSPNNEDLAYNPDNKSYDGKLSLTMTGYWKINLMLENENGEVLKGEEVTEDNESSSLFFEIEF